MFQSRKLQFRFQFPQTNKITAHYYFQKIGTSTVYKDVNQNNNFPNFILGLINHIHNLALGITPLTISFSQYSHNLNSQSNNTIREIYLTQPIQRDQRLIPTSIL